MRKGSIRISSFVRHLSLSSSSVLALGALMGATSPLLSANVAMAASNTAKAVSNTVSLEEIVVTAEKREQSLQTIPLSVTAFSQQALDIRGASNVESIQHFTPNLDFSVQSAGQHVARITLRGIGSETLVGGGDPGVALHIDGVYVGRNSAAAVDIFDVDRVEVLRGPQGTLYGRNANGGSINIITHKPVDKLALSGDFTVGNYSELRARGMVNVPITDNLFARLTVFSESHDGYMKNLWAAGRDSQDKDAHAGRLQLRWVGDGGNEIILRGFYEKMGGSGPGSRFLGTDNPTADGYPAVYAIGLSKGPMPPPGVNIVADAYRHPNPAIGDAVLPLPSDLHKFRKDAPEFVDQLIRGVDMTLNWDLSDKIGLRSITAYQTNDNDILVDADNSELPLETRQRNNMAKQFSQEFNLISQGESRLKWILGLYFYRETLTEIFHSQTNANILDPSIPLPPGGIAGGSGVGQTQTANHRATSYAVFGQATYSLTERLDFTLGARYTWDRKHQERHGGGRVDLTTDLRFNGFGATGSLPPDSGDANFSNWSGKAALQYQMTDENMVYASYSRGFKSGGLDFNGGLLDTGELSPYGPETIDAYEIGSKNRFLDNRVQLNLAAFYYDYKGLQVFRLTGSGPITDNASKSTIKGVEAELQIAATEHFNIDGSFGYLNAKYGDYTVNIPFPQDFSGNWFNYAPRITGHVGAEYTVPVTDTNSLTGRVDYAYHGKTYFDRANTPMDEQKGYSLVNLRVRLAGDAWHVDAYVNNLFDKQYVVGQLINPPFNCGCRTINVGLPRVMGITAGYKY